MIYLTGDTHADFKRFSKGKMSLSGLNLTENDYIIVCGDFGLCWAKDKTFQYDCDIFKNKPYKILWVQGNHENYDMIEEFPIEEWNGGKVRHIVRDKVILLERGQIFEIEGQTFFTFGGGTSHDTTGGILDRCDPDFQKKRKRAVDMKLPYRVLRESWWPQELPTEEEMQEGRLNLIARNYKVDYVITHCIGTRMQNQICEMMGKHHNPDVITDYFQELEGVLTYKHWYFGHYHADYVLDECHTLLYHEIIPLDIE